jgi:plasmid maintenance system antidote protein VapI
MLINLKRNYELWHYKNLSGTQNQEKEQKIRNKKSIYQPAISYQSLF